MKKIILCFILLLSLVSCTNKPVTTSNFTIVTSIFPIYSLVKELVPNDTNVVMLVPPGANTHSFEPTPNDIIAIQKSNIMFTIGGENETWLTKTIDAIDKKDSIVQLIKSVEVHEEEHEEDHHHDEHIWTSLRNSEAMVKTITDALIETKHFDNDQLIKNRDRVLSTLQQYDNEIKALTDTKKTIMVADHNPFNYFAHDYDLTIISPYVNCNNDADVSSKVIQELIETVKEKNITTIATIEFSDQLIAKTISEATSCAIVQLHSCHNVSLDDFNNNVTYLSIMKNNIQVLKQLLQ